MKLILRIMQGLMQKKIKREISDPFMRPRMVFKKQQVKPNGKLLPHFK